MRHEFQQHQINTSMRHFMKSAQACLNSMWKLFWTTQSVNPAYAIIYT